MDLFGTITKITLTEPTDIKQCDAVQNIFQTARHIRSFHEPSKINLSEFELNETYGLHKYSTTHNNSINNHDIHRNTDDENMDELFKKLQTNNTRNKNSSFLSSKSYSILPTLQTLSNNEIGNDETLARTSIESECLISRSEVIHLSSPKKNRIERQVTPFAFNRNKECNEQSIELEYNEQKYRMSSMMKSMSDPSSSKYYNSSYYSYSPSPSPMTNSNIQWFEKNGYLHKKSPTKFVGWQRRWFYLFEDCLDYYKDNTALPKGSIFLCNIECIHISEDSKCISNSYPNPNHNSRNITSNEISNLTNVSTIILNTFSLESSNNVCNDNSFMIVMNGMFA